MGKTFSSVSAQYGMIHQSRRKWSVRVREAATDKRITPLLSTPGALTPEQRNMVKKGKTLIFFLPVTRSHLFWVRQELPHDILSCSAQGKDIFLARARMQHPKVWPCSSVQPSSRDTRWMDPVSGIWGQVWFQQSGDFAKICFGAKCSI